MRQQVEKTKITIAAEAEAEKTRREAQGHADATLLKYEAEAKGIRQVLEAKAQGYQALVQSAGNDARAAATLLLTEKLEHLVAMQVEAIKAIKIDKVTVWDAGNGGEWQWRQHHGQLPRRHGQEPAAAARRGGHGRARAAEVPGRHDEVAELPAANGKEK